MTETTTQEETKDAPPIDVAAQLAELRERTGNIERLRTADAAQRVKGHRPALEIHADRDRERRKLTDMARERDRLSGREARETKVRQGQLRAQEMACKQLAVAFVLEDYPHLQAPTYKVPADFLTDFHKQHYAVAKFEAELEALRKALGPGALA